MNFGSPRLTIDLAAPVRSWGMYRTLQYYYSENTRAALRQRGFARLRPSLLLSRAIGSGPTRPSVADGLTYVVLTVSQTTVRVPATGGEHCPAKGGSRMISSEWSSQSR